MFLSRTPDTDATPPTPTVTDLCLSDHFVVTTALPFPKPKRVVCNVSRRNFKSIDMSSFKASLSDSISSIMSGISSFSFSDCIKNVLDKFAPLKDKRISVRPAAPWMNLVVKAQKQIKRRAERLFKKTKLTVHREIFKYQKNKTIKVINDEKKKYINDKITESNNSRNLYSFFNRLTGKQSSLVIPTDTPIQTLPDKFNTFFVDKISKIRNNLDSVSSSHTNSSLPYQKSKFGSFEPVTPEHVKKVIMASKKSFCELDHLPADVFMDCLDILLPAITQIFNESLTTGTFPSDFKNSLVIPLLKKSSLDCNVLKNYRPVTNLTFISKVLEKLVFNQLVEYLSHNDLIEHFQSAYKAGHSTETALLRVANDILCSVDTGSVAMLTMLDLSAAFDTLDHQILLERLFTSFGICDTVLNWFKSYLENRKQKVKINSHYSDELSISFGVPQGSVLGPLLFTMYVYPISDVIKNKDFDFHLYADDTQLYSSFKASNVNASLTAMSDCASDINEWMIANKLKMNTDKTEVMLCGTSSKLKSINVDSADICDDTVSFSSHVKNLGVFMDQNFNLQIHISKTRQKCYFELRKISHFRPFINEKSTIQLIISLVMSKIDYCNCLFYRMSEENFHKLQLVQNHAARLVTKADKRANSLSLLKELHWLPIKQRVSYKVALMVFKCLNDESFPVYLKELITVYTPTRTLRSADKCLLVKPKMNLVTFGQKSFYHAAPEVWNQLPFNLRSCKVLSIFKKLLKTHFFKIAFE